MFYYSQIILGEIVLASFLKNRGCTTYSFKRTYYSTGGISPLKKNDSLQDSRVVKSMANTRNYRVLEEVNTDASVGYLMKVINTNEKLVSSAVKHLKNGSNHAKADASHKDAH